MIKLYSMEIIYDHLSKIIFWNMILRLIIEGYLDYAVDSITNV
jgi:hypothetical protein